MLETRRPRPMKKTAKPLPQKGAVCQQWKRCGRPGCRCARGQLHGPYYALFWREKGRLRKRYVPRAEALAVQVACLEHRAQERVARREKQIAWRRWQVLRRRLKELVGHD